MARNLCPEEFLKGPRVFAVPMKSKAVALAKTGGRCWYCGATAKGLDHIKPRSQGGSNHPDNLIPCCARCNKSKGTKTTEEFRRFVQWRTFGAPNFSRIQLKWLATQGFNPQFAAVVFFGEAQA